MVVLHCIFITIDDNKYPAPENFPGHKYQQQGNAQEGGEVQKIRGDGMPLQRKQYSELFCLFSELHKIVGAEYEQARDITCFVSCWVPQQHPPPRDKKF